MVSPRPFAILASIALALAACQESGSPLSHSPALLAIGQSCQAAEAEGQTLGVNEFTFQSTPGSVLLLLDGSAAGPVTVTTYILAPPKATDDGVLIANTSHVVELSLAGDGACAAGEDCFATDDHAVLEPINPFGLFRLNSTMRIAAGFGRFATPREVPPLQVHGTIQFPPPGVPVPPVATWELKGRVCGG
ncbi:MAG TPA: hypothetical protein VGA78_15205 [Gemmatimonadales bacterium]